MLIGTRLLSPDNECTSFLTSCQTTQDLRYKEIGKFQESP